MATDLFARPNGLAVRSGGAASALSSLGQSQGDLLSALRDPAGEGAAMLTALMVSNSLLELSKLATARLSLVEFAQAALNSLAQCTPFDACALRFAVPDLPVVRHSLGDWPAETEDGALLDGSSPRLAKLRVAPLATHGDTDAIGYLGIGGAPAALFDAGFVERAADHLSSMLGLLIEAERLRRAAAASRALDLIGALDDSYGEDDIFEIVAALQQLPGAEAASALLEIPRFAGPITVSAGVVREGAPSSVVQEAIERRGTLTVEVWWAAGGEPFDSRFGEVAERFAHAVSRAEQTARLLEEVETDTLTGIGNRRCAARALMQARARCGRDGEEYAVLMMDLDKFKSVNDTYGHEVGDEVLCAFARAIQSVVRGYDVPTRWGGEEFLIVSPGTGVEGAQAIARRLLEATPAICEPAFPDGHRQTVSIGVAIGRDPSVDPLEIVRQADGALYEAKHGGRDRFVVASPGKRAVGR